MPSTYNFATKASPKVQEAFYKESLTEGIFSQEYDWTGVATVRIYSVDDLPMQDYDWDATSGSRFGSLTELGDTIQELTVNQDKSFNGAIDKRNNTSELMIKAAGKVLARQTRNVIVPMVDQYRLAAIAAGNGVTGFGGAGGGFIKYNISLTKSNIIETIMTHNAELNNALVPTKNRVLFIKESEFIKCKLADQIVGTEATLQEVAKNVIVNGEFGRLDALHIVPVPDSYMPDGVLYMIVTKGCCVSPKKIETMRVIADHPDIDGHVVQGRMLYDCFVLAKKANGILVATSAAGGTT